MASNLTTERLWITEMSHPHYGESGYLTGRVIVLTDHDGTRMAEFRLEHCTHGVDACFVGHGVLASEKREKLR